MPIVGEAAQVRRHRSAIPRNVILITVLTLVIAICALLVVPFMRQQKLEKLAAKKSSANGVPTASPNAVSGETNPIPIGNGWYYFREPKGSDDLAEAILSYLRYDAAARNFSLTIVCPANKDGGIPEKIDGRLAAVAQTLALTNGYFVKFR